MDNSLNQTCPVTGNSDLYGLGIRLGIYLQMVAVQLSGLSSAVLKTQDYLSPGTVIFVLATGAVLVRELVHRSIEPVEVFPILTLLLAQVGVCRVPHWKGQTLALIYAIEMAGLIVLFLWFWWHGMDTLPRSCHDDKAFFFAKVSIWHWFRTFNKVSSIFFALAGSMAVLVYFVAIVYTTAARIVAHVRGVAAAAREEQQQDSNLGAVDFLVNVGAIVYVEMALKWNHISGVHSLAAPGQFMPFFIALAQLATVVYDIARTGLSLAADEESQSTEGSEDGKLMSNLAADGQIADKHPAEFGETECHHAKRPQDQAEILPMSSA